MKKEYWIINGKDGIALKDFNKGGGSHYGFIKYDGEDVTKKIMEVCKELVGKKVMLYSSYANQEPEEYTVVYDYPCFRSTDISCYWNSYYRAASGNYTVKRLNNGIIRMYGGGSGSRILADLDKNKEYTEEEVLKIIENGKQEQEKKKQDKLEKSGDLRDKLILALSKYKSRMYNAGTSMKATGIRFKHLVIYFYLDNATLIMKVNDLIHSTEYKADLSDPKNDPVKLMEEIIELQIRAEEIISKKWAEKQHG